MSIELLNYEIGMCEESIERLSECVKQLFAEANESKTLIEKVRKGRVAIKAFDKLTKMESKRERLLAKKDKIINRHNK